ncbi:MAG TPA: hypothetical protein VH186_26510 [Chloroflexia bacterium]|nr:hypothetical protein [Chloroflexia bacterium]
MSGEELYQWFEQEVKKEVPEADSKLMLSYEPTVTPGVFLGKISLKSSPNRALVKSDVRPEGVRMNFPVDWGDELSEWLGAPPADAYRLKSNWVHQPSIGVAVSDFEPYFKQLGAKVIEILRRKVAA